MQQQLSELIKSAQNISIKKDELHHVHGQWNHHDIERLTNMVYEIEGDFAEIGVFKGDAFGKVVTMAAIQGKMAHAFDSFQGMDHPSEFDGTFYPKGKFDIGGPEMFRRIMSQKGIPEDLYRLYEGYIPICLEKAPDTLRFSFVILDVDHYEPTVVGLDWIWPRLNDLGILALDDFPPENPGLATKAIKEFLRKENNFDIIDFFNNQLILRKLPDSAL